MKPEREIQIICATRQLAREYVNEFHRAAEALHLRPIARRAEARRLAAGISVFLLDQSGIEASSKQVLKRTVERLVEVAPVIVVAAPERQSELTALLNSGATDFVARTGNFVPVAVGGTALAANLLRVEGFLRNCRSARSLFLPKKVYRSRRQCIAGHKNQPVLKRVFGTCELPIKSTPVEMRHSQIADDEVVPVP